MGYELLITPTDYLAYTSQQDIILAFCGQIRTESQERKEVLGKFGSDLSALGGPKHSSSNIGSAYGLLIWRVPELLFNDGWSLRKVSFDESDGNHSEWEWSESIGFLNMKKTSAND